MTEREERLAGNVGGAVRVGGTVRRATGPWTPAVHALLAYLNGPVPHVPRVHGLDAAGREILDYLPGRVVDTEAEPLGDGQLLALVRWTRTFHEAVAGFRHPGPWRYFPLPEPSMIGHNDIAPYNACFDGDELVGVFDWDMSGPTNPRWELAFIAWNCVPLWRDLGPADAARRLRLIADGYGGYDPVRILLAVPRRITVMIEGIPVAAAAGDPGMVNLMTRGEPERTRAGLAGVVERTPGILAALA